MDNDLERSVRLLEDALSTPTKGLFKLSTPSRKSFQRDYSISLAPEEFQRALATDRTFEHDTVALMLEGDKTITGSVIQSGLPWENTLSNLYGEFATIIQNSINGADILEITADLARCCSDALTVIQGLKSKVAVQAEIPEEICLENERNNWRLLFVLYQDRLQYQDNGNNQEMEQYVGHSEKLCVDCLFKRDHLIRESQLVIDWLERNALERDDPILHHSDWTYGWENTLHQLLSPDTIAIGSNADIVKSIYPDAPLVENLPLHHLDDECEKKLAHRIFAEIRCGKLQDAEDLCISCGHPWKAVMLEGWKLYHNPNIKESSNGAVVDTEYVITEESYIDVEGNRSRDLWKAMAIEYCKTDGINIYDRASIATLSGYLEAILPVCNSWEDFLWAYMKTVVDIRVESEIRDSIIRDYKKLPDEYWEQKMSLNQIFKLLGSSKNTRVRSESQEPDHVIQTLIILDEIEKLIESLNDWVDNDDISTHSLRFYAHLVLFFDHIGKSTNRTMCENIIEKYISRLSEMNETQLVAFYVSKLGKKKQIDIYANHLEKITDNELRKSGLSFGENHGLDVLAITKRVVESVRNRPTTIPTDKLTTKISPDDEDKISAIDWLLFYDEQRAEAVAQTNALIFTFLTIGKVEAAQILINKIPSNSVSKIRSEGEVNNEINQTLKEFLSYKTYLEAHEAFNDWFKQHQSKPLPPTDLPDSAPFTEKVAHEHKIAQYNSELERWKLGTLQSAKITKTLMYNVLLFPEGWLTGGEDSDYLRSICIPEIVLLLYLVLSESEEHEEAVQLADLIAAEKNGLYRVYSKEKLAEILEKICESSVALLNAKKDPWGCDATA